MLVLSDASGKKRDCIEKSMSRFPGRPVLCKINVFPTLPPGGRAPNETPLTSPVELKEASSIVFTVLTMRSESVQVYIHE